MFKGVPHSTVFAGNWLSRSFSIELNVNLRMAWPDLGASLIHHRSTKHRTTAMSVKTTGVLWIISSPLLKWVSKDFYCGEKVTLWVGSGVLHTLL